ncbi:MAG: D-alanine--D-alanine ligase [Alphaproteobacteria bacterium]|nr:D-alanine--D-alanine ligase [Pseudomonadota bacterium]MCH7633633.1 D-alanine--D-alanine ligase [Pseudomonadota bacterium]TDI58554.1 MAG: D-alanine--D-alanine ligase [Alphaproteobacteria bacterium]
MTKHVAVLYGGWSSEREVSLVSGRNCAKTLEESGYEVTLIDVEHDLTALIAALDPAPDVVFNALHGRHGEDGKIQGLLDILEIPYTHSGALASALAMDKPMAKRLFAAAAIPCPDGRIVRREELANGPVIDPPYVIKPPNEGSSVGVRIVLEGDNRPPLDDWPFGDLVLVESYIPGRELTVGVMGDRALGVTELRTHEGFYDYAAKYEEGRATHLCPAPIPDEIADLAMEYALKAHETLGCRGVSRADLRYDDTGGQPGDLYMLEINTQPGMTPLSLVPEVAAHAGIDFPQLVSWIVEDASCPR